jgi:N-acetylglucosamine-6-phosphate deacetylase
MHVSFIRGLFADLDITENKKQKTKKMAGQEFFLQPEKTRKAQQIHIDGPAITAVECGAQDTGIVEHMN